MSLPTLYQLALSAIMCTVIFTGNVLAPRAATAATYYVATNGSNANAGTESEPFGTIDQGIRALRAGDTLYIRAGTYAQPIGYPSSVIQIPSGTSWSHPVTIAGFPGETVIIQSIEIVDGYGTSYVIFDNLTLENRLYIGSCDTHDVRFMNGEITVSPASPAGTSVVLGCGSIEVLNSKIHGAPEGYGFYWLGHDSLFDGNEVYDNGGYAYHIFQSGANDVSNNVVSNNTIHGNGFNGPLGGNGSGGIILSSGSNNQALNNIVYGNYGGIDVDYMHGGTNNQVSGNTIYDNAYRGITIGAGALNTIVENNIVYHNGRTIDDYGVGTILIDNSVTDPNK